MITHHATLGASNIRNEKHEHNNSEIFTGDIMNQVYEGFFDNCFYQWMYYEYAGHEKSTKFAFCFKGHKKLVIIPLTNWLRNGESNKNIVKTCCLNRLLF